LLQARIDAGGELDKDSHPLDVASLVKQFIRQLPEPLLSSRLQAAFIQCHQLSTEAQRVATVHLLCLLLPRRHLAALRFAAGFFSRVAQQEVGSFTICVWNVE